MKTVNDMTLRDYFAAKAAQTFVQGASADNFDALAVDAYRFADSMLKARDTPQAQPAQKRPQNCGTGYCSCIECVVEPAQQEPFGYFKAEPFGWTDCAETDEGAIALYTSPPAQRTALPDAITDTSETLEYISGWNECREVMKGMMK